jgi:putative Mg2+ transporter-C (MgtC) family protein
MAFDLGTEIDLAARLLLSAFLGALIGLEREFHDHPAGMRTHLLVSLGAASFTVLSIAAFQASGGDTSRIAAQIVSGVGFLGAGAILKEGANVRGLTTAASLWAVAAVGMAAGAGTWAIAVTITVIVLLSLWPLRLVTERFIAKDQSRVRFTLLTADPHALGRVVAAVVGHGGSIAHLSTKEAPGGQSIDLEARVKDPAAAARMMTIVGDIEGVRTVEATAPGE